MIIALADQRSSNRQPDRFGREVESVPVHEAHNAR